jgi:hypothetical protein
LNKGKGTERGKQEAHRKLSVGKPLRERSLGYFAYTGI